MWAYGFKGSRVNGFGPQWPELRKGSVTSSCVGRQGLPKAGSETGVVNHKP